MQAPAAPGVEVRSRRDSVESRSIENHRVPPVSFRTPDPPQPEFVVYRPARPRLWPVVLGACGWTGFGAVGVAGFVRGEPSPSYLGRVAWLLVWVLGGAVWMLSAMIDRARTVVEVDRAKGVLTITRVMWPLRSTVRSFALERVKDAVVHADTTDGLSYGLELVVDGEPKPVALGEVQTSDARAHEEAARAIRALLTRSQLGG